MLRRIAPVLILLAVHTGAPAHAQIAGGLRLEGVETCAQLSAFVARNPRFDSAMVVAKRDALGGCVPVPAPRPAAPARPAPATRVTPARPAPRPAAPAPRIRPTAPVIPRITMPAPSSPAPVPAPAPRPPVVSITPRLNAPSLTPRLNLTGEIPDSRATTDATIALNAAPEITARADIASPPEALDLSLGQEYLRAAQAGDARAMGKVAEFYRSGQGGLGQHPDAAVEWAKQADAHGDPWGRYILGLCFEAADGELAEDPDEAYRLFRLAAEVGVAPAMGKVGEYLYQGWGAVQRDDDEALIWLQRAAQVGDPRSEYYLALFHLDGLAGLPRDPDKAPP